MNPSLLQSANASEPLAQRFPISSRGDTIRPQFGEPAVHPEEQQLSGDTVTLSHTATTAPVESGIASPDGALTSTPDPISSESVLTADKKDVEEPQSNPSEAPVDNNRAAMNIFRGVKILGEGGVTAFFLSKMSALPFFNTFLMETLFSIGELGLGKIIFDAKNPAAQKILALSNKLVHGPDKPVTELTDQEKQNCLVPVATTANLISGVLMGGINYFRRKTVDFTKEEQAYQAAVEKCKEALPAFRKLLAKAELTSLELIRTPMVRAIRTNKKFIIPLAVFGSGVGGLLEGVSSKWITKAYKLFTQKPVETVPAVD